ncbi:hypothetical protein DUNSADRAFT_1395 [Dunaliella salina]|uniref:Uncharacterized protein n=1 Tax=Dunaliella salina TaxID=3046 RepID=A0ABQ7GX32_DUNSA|nr:hypothetical protein DUNSADRAFT_1395 [Dunaliella salina]|eukprot:KAF5839168.1 hypothetical protein DUNSADRAFT_1395 [Dunaliella salina]
MKPGYAKKKAKAKAKKQALKSGKGQKQGENQHDGDEMMVDADAHAKGVDNQGAEVDYEMHDDGEEKAQQGGSHKSKVEAKRALKVKVQQMKSNRTKATKMPHGKRQAAKKEVSAGMKELILEQQQLNAKDTGKKGKGKKQAS